LGTAHLLEQDRDKEAAKSALRTSIQYAEKMNNQSESARALYYLSSSGFLLAGAEGLGSIISESEKIYAYLDRALELTPDDPELILQKASGLAYPPKLFGGDPKKAIVLLERGLKVNDLYDYIRFDLLSTLSYCYQREGNNKEALDLANEALLLYPDNADLIKRQKELIKKVK
jgi:tetratricopeptide (TPR) repeat protein